MDQFKVDVMTRLWALEHVVQHIGTRACLAAELQPAHVRSMAELARKQMAEETFPGNDDPVLADHVAAEIGTHIDRLLSGIADDVTKAYQLAARGGQKS